MHCVIFFLFQSLNSKSLREYQSQLIPVRKCAAVKTSQRISSIISMVPSITEEEIHARNRLPINWSRFPISGQGIKEKIQERDPWKKGKKSQEEEI